MKNVRIVIGNVESCGAEAIVNAANPRLKRGSGVCGAIYRAAGEQDLTNYVQSHFPEGCSTGYCVVTPAFNLEQSGTRLIIHAVGPIYADYRPHHADALLASSFRHIFETCYAMGIKHVGVVAVSSGVYGFPVEEVAQIAAEEVRKTVYNGQIDFVIWANNLPAFVTAFPQALVVDPSAAPAALPSTTDDDETEASDVVDPTVPVSAPAVNDPFDLNLRSAGATNAPVTFDDIFNRR